MRFLILLSLLASCASPIRFQKKSHGMGYTVKNLTNQKHFEVLVSLPEGTTPDLRMKYGWAGAIEECQARGFEFVDYSEHTPDLIEARCYPTNEVKRLGILYYQSGLNEHPKKFIVEKVDAKEGGEIKPGDVVISIDGQKIFSMPQIKTIIFAKAEKAKFLKVEIIRDQRVMTVKEPFIDSKDVLMTKNDLITYKNNFR